MQGNIFTRYILEFTVFVCGALVMVYEIIGSRIVSPFIGTSTYVWTSLIGVILGALSLGYWLGGKWADRRADVKVLAFVIFTAGVAVSATVLMKDVVMSFIAAMPFGLELKSVVAALILFAPASVALGFVSPYAVKLKTSSLDVTGRTVGRLYALSTVGSITGTFVAGFVLIPFVGSVRTLYIVAAGLIGLSLLLAPLALTRFTFVGLTLFVFGIAGSEATVYLMKKANNLHDIDTEYARVQVYDTKNLANGRDMRVIATDPYFVQSAVYLDDGGSALEYGRFYHLLAHFKPDFKDTLLIGGAGYTFPKEYLERYPHANIEVVEIDPEMTRIAREFFGLRDDERLKISHRDGRVFLNSAPAAKYDVVLMDAFGSLFTVPYHLTTVEAVREFSRVLKDDGLVIFNLGSAIRGEASGFLQAEFRTYQEVFPYVYLFKVRKERGDEELQNLIITASKRPLMMESRDAEAATLLSHLYTGEFPLERPVLTDDLAPVEYYNSLAQDVFLANR